MKDLLIKADRLTLDVIERRVQRWVERHNNEKHAIDFMIRFEWVQFAALIIWGVTVPAALYIVKGDSLGAGIHVATWSVLAVMEWFGIQYTIHEIKPIHDFFFKLRENAEYVKMHAEMLEQMFVKTRRQRLEMTAGILGSIAVLFAVAHFAANNSAETIVWQYLFVNAAANRLKQYLMYVNDMEPPQKKKKASEAITELLQRLWGEFIGGFNPMPQPSFRKI